MRDLFRPFRDLGSFFILLGAVLGLAAFSSSAFQKAGEGRDQRTFWSPLDGSRSRADYAGPEGCAQCHAAETEGQKATPMAHAAERPAEAKILREHPELSFRQGPYLYTIHRQGDRFLYTVSDSENSITEPIVFALGVGSVGQTYVIEHDGAYYESRVSYFSPIKALDITFEHSRTVPASLEAALGKRLSPGDARLCFGCHDVAAVTQNWLDVSQLMPGVSCEGCHGPAAKHMAAMKAGKFDPALISNPAKLNPGDLADFCGTCHRTWEQIALTHVTGVRNVRFQPYRLIESSCWNSDDARISCLACHDPHQPRHRESAFYDSKCLACHVEGRGAKRTSARPGPACPVRDRDCVTCHMPKVELPDGHSKFTDHEIRIARPGAPYPN